ncbi:YHYH protein [Granulosicoccus sp.]|nr:YHYH protein [Granulosicoccus sp.]
MLSACGSDDATVVDIDDTITEGTTPDSELIQAAYLDATTLISNTRITCGLEDGTSVDCLQLTFSANPANVVQGPYCPETIDDAVSVTIYDGPNNPGFQVVTRPLFEAMEADGFNIVEDDGSVHDFDSEQRDDWDYCLGGGTTAGVEVTYQIPATPVLAASNRIVSTTDFDLVGLSLNGIPIAGDPPSIFNGPGRGIAGGNIPALDACGGHPDPGGWYHWHFFAETMNKVLDEFGITDVSCTSVEQATGTELIGFAIDGFPIYAYDNEPAGLDECRGVTAITSEFPDGTYQYVAGNALAPNAPDCLKGLTANNFFVSQ